MDKINYYVMLEWFDEELDTEFMPASFIPATDYKTAKIIAIQITTDMMTYANFGEPTEVYIIEQPVVVWDVNKARDTQDFIYKLQQPKNSNVICQDILVRDRFEPSFALVEAVKEYIDSMKNNCYLD